MNAIDQITKIHEWEQVMILTCFRSLIKNIQRWGYNE